jgi:hypothetical protein
VVPSTRLQHERSRSMGRGAGIGTWTRSQAGLRRNAFRGAVLLRARSRCGHGRALVAAGCRSTLANPAWAQHAMRRRKVAGASWPSPRCPGAKCARHRLPARRLRGEEARGFPRGVMDTSAPGGRRGPRA